MEFLVSGEEAHVIIDSGRSLLPRQDGLNRLLVKAVSRQSAGNLLLDCGPYKERFPDPCLVSRRDD